VKRRVWLQQAGGAVAATAAWPVRSWAQSLPPRRIGYLHPRTIAPTHPTLVVLRAAWRRLGYVEGESVLLRAANDDMQRVPALAHELVQQGAGVLIVVGAQAVRSVSQALPATPIVAIDLETDPVRAGYAASLAHPGGHVTGLFLDMPSLAGKWIDLLREAAPGIERLALSWDRSTGVDQLEVAKRVARDKGFDAVVLSLNEIRDFDAALKPLAGRPRTGVVQLSSPGFVVVANAFSAAARKHGLPAIAFLKAYARSGVLMTYGPIQEQYFPRAVVLADRILKGDSAAELPIEGPDRFELAINLRTAKALGLTITQTLRLRADEVIE
jgi:putative ABC transport system substrate-binding protein